MAIGIKSSSTETTVAGAALATASLVPAISNLLAATQACLCIRIWRARRAEAAAKQADDPTAQLEASAARVDDIEREVRAIADEDSPTRNSMASEPYQSLLEIAS